MKRSHSLSTNIPHGESLPIQKLPGFAAQQIVLDSRASRANLKPDLFPDPS